MAEQHTLRAEDVVRIIPNCPSCGSDRYHSVTENAQPGFCLRAVRCEVCHFDILNAFLHLPPPSQMRKPGWRTFALLAGIAIFELAFLLSLFL
jgi:hypothetical protein